MSISITTTYLTRVRICRPKKSATTYIEKINTNTILKKNLNKLPHGHRISTSSFTLPRKYHNAVITYIPV
ncbi:MAG: hypothetical protein WBF08_00900 [Candidatus Bathyarchaeia archaeon]